MPARSLAAVPSILRMTMLGARVHSQHEGVGMLCSPSSCYRLHAMNGWNSNTGGPKQEKPVLRMPFTYP